MKACAIVGAGDFFPEHFKKESYDFIIAADGGWQSLREIGVRPNIVIGDFDSSDMPPDIPTLRHKVEKDETDMHLAFLEGVRLGYKKFYVHGGTGGRDDHTFANYCLLLFAKRQKKEMYLIGKTSRSFVIENESVTLYGAPGNTFSVFALGGEASGVYIAGAKYEAADATLRPEFPLGVSNSFTESPAQISVSSGALLIIGEY